MIKGFRHTGIVVKEIEKSVKFYTELLGLKVVKRQNEGVEYIKKLLGKESIDSLETVKLATEDGFIIELLSFRPFEVRADRSSLFMRGLTHLALTVDDIDEVYGSLSCKGVEFVSEPLKSPDGYAKLAFCIAPDDVYLELVEIL